MTEFYQSRCGVNRDKHSMNRVFIYFVLSIAVLLAAVAFWTRPNFLFPSPQQNIVVIMLDTLRPDHLGIYGYPRNTSPAIDELAKRGTVFTSAYSVSNWTNPAIKSIFTGLSPQAVMREAKHKDAIRMPLPKEVTTFAELVKTRDYRTAGLVDHPGIKPNGNFNQGFDDYTMLYTEGAKGRGAWGKSDIAHVASEFEEHLDEYLNDPFLIYLHVVYPHRPYKAPSPYQGMFGQDSYDGYKQEMRKPLINAYDAEIKRTDDLIAMIHEAISSRGLLEDTWIILLSDHGEGFWEHGFAEHGSVFFNEMIKIPLIVVPPMGQQNGAKRVDTPVSNLDVFSTILDIAGVPAPEGTMGFSLIEGDSSAQNMPSRVLFSESAHSFDIRARTIIRNGMKYSNYPKTEGVVLFNLNRDPFEYRDLFGTMPKFEAESRKLLKEHQEQSMLERSWLKQHIVEPNKSTLEGLKTLGYIQ